MIETKRFNNRPHTEDELLWWIKSYCARKIPEYQMSAWLMAVCWRGMTLDETGLLTKYMVQSGATLLWPSSSIPKVDKHSSGGVGDKVSLILAPLVACAGLQVPMMAGRGLGHTGGTLDKLESIPGYAVQQSEESFQAIVQSVGCSIVSTTPNMVLADRKLYALRDVTGTVSSIPLQTSSILSKKIAENPDSLVLDVKYGRGSFQSTLKEAQELAISLIHTAEMNGVKPTTAFLTRMDIPIGRGIGNWLEVKECLSIMKDGVKEADKNLLQLILIQSAQMIYQSAHRDDCTLDDIIHDLIRILDSGDVYQKFREMVQAHGGDVTVLDNPDEYPTAKYTYNIVSPKSGFVSDIDALQIGQASVKLGAGRQATDDTADPLAGIWLHKVVGENLDKGDVIATLFTSISNDILEEVSRQIQNTIRIADTIPLVPPIISHAVTSEGIAEFVMPLLFPK
jgi:pyrimidine-nucleoside phosphorylase